MDTLGTKWSPLADTDQEALGSQSSEQASTDGSKRVSNAASSQPIAATLFSHPPATNSPLKYAHPPSLEEMRVARSPFGHTDRDAQLPQSLEQAGTDDSEGVLNAASTITTTHSLQQLTNLPLTTEIPPPSIERSWTLVAEPGPSADTDPDTVPHSPKLVRTDGSKEVSNAASPFLVSVAPSLHQPTKSLPTDTPPPSMRNAQSPFADTDRDTLPSQTHEQAGTDGSEGAPNAAFSLLASAAPSLHRPTNTPPINTPPPSIAGTATLVAERGPSVDIDRDTPPLQSFEQVHTDGGRDVPKAASAPPSWHPSTTSPPTAAPLPSNKSSPPSSSCWRSFCCFPSKRKQPTDPEKNQEPSRTGQPPRPPIGPKQISMPIETGHYTIENIAQKHLVYLRDSNKNTPVAASVEQNNNNEIWIVNQLSSGNYTIQNVGTNMFAVAGHQAEKDEVVRGWTTRQQWILKKTRVPGSFTIESTDSHLFWSFEDNQENTPVTLSDAPTDKRTFWIFKQAQNYN